MDFKSLIRSVSLVSLLVSCQEDPVKAKCESNFTSTSIIGKIDWIRFNQTGDSSQDLNEQTVAQIKIPSIIAVCTGFLINEDTIMTNNHCISSPSMAINVSALFRREDGTRTSFVCDQFITTNFQYDFTLIKCKKAPGEEFGWVGLSNDKPVLNTNIYLVQENCDYITDPRCIVDKYVSFGQVLGSQATRFYHDADTLAGSSGSPVFSKDSHQVIAIHNAGALTTNPAQAKNAGVPMYQIRNIIQDTTDVIIHEFGSVGEFHTETFSTYEPVESSSDNDCKS